MDSARPPSAGLMRLEAELAVAIAREDDQPRELLERLVDELLAVCGGLSPLNTDGLIVSRELRAGEVYLAVGHVWMLPASVTEPVLIRLVIGGGSVAGGEVSFGLASDRPTAPSMSHGKSLKLLLADPEHAQHGIPWAYRFRRDADGWVLVD